MRAHRTPVLGKTEDVEGSGNGMHTELLAWEENGCPCYGRRRNGELLACREGIWDPGMGGRKEWGGPHRTES